MSATRSTDEVTLAEAWEASDGPALVVVTIPMPTWSSAERQADLLREAWPDADVKISPDSSASCEQRPCPPA